MPRCARRGRCAGLGLSHRIRALADPQLAHRQALSVVEDEGGSFRVLNLPFRMSGADTAPGKTMAVLGEHTHELREEVGLADDAPILSGRTAVQR